MRKLLFTCALALLAQMGYSQNVQPSTKVRQGFDQKALHAMNDSQVEYLNYFVNNSYIVHNEAKTKDGLPLLSSVLKQGKSPIAAENLNQADFNPLNYNITVHPSESQFFLVDGSNKVVQIHSQATIDMQYDRFLVNQQKLNSTKK